MRHELAEKTIKPFLDKKHKKFPLIKMHFVTQSSRVICINKVRIKRNSFDQIRQWRVRQPSCSQERFRSFPWRSHYSLAWSFNQIKPQDKLVWRRSKSNCFLSNFCSLVGNNYSFTVDVLEFINYLRVTSKIILKELDSALSSNETCTSKVIAMDAYLRSWKV